MKGGASTTQKKRLGAFVDFFENLFTSGGGGDFEVLEKKVTASMNVALLRPFTEDEIKGAIFLDVSS